MNDPHLAGSLNETAPAVPGRVMRNDQEVRVRHLHQTLDVHLDGRDTIGGAKS